MFADRQSGGGAYDTFIYLCDTTPSVGHASVDESLIALDFPHFLRLLYRGHRAPGGSSFIHLRELRSFPLFLPLHTLKSHLYWSIDSQRLYPQPLTPPSSADGRVKKSSSCPADSFAFPLPLLIFTSPTYLLSSSGLPLTLILT